MRIVGWGRESGLACQSLVNEISAGEIRKVRNKSKLMPDPRDAPLNASVGDDQLSVKSPRFRFPCQPSNLTILHEPDGIDLL